MGAVVDAHAACGIIVRAAPSARLRGRLMDDGRDAVLGEADSGGKTGEPGADDVNGAGHQMKAWRATIQAIRSLLGRTRVRGATKPCETIFSSMAR